MQQETTALQVHSAVYELVRAVCNMHSHQRSLSCESRERKSRSVPWRDTADWSRHGQLCWTTEVTMARTGLVHGDQTSQAGKGACKLSVHRAESMCSCTIIMNVCMHGRMPK